MNWLVKSIGGTLTGMVGIIKWWQRHEETGTSHAFLEGVDNGSTTLSLSIYMSQQERYTKMYIAECSFTIAKNYKHPSTEKKDLITPGMLTQWNTKQQ